MSKKITMNGHVDKWEDSDTRGRVSLRECCRDTAPAVSFFVSITYQKERKKCSFLNSIEFSGQVWYHNLATQIL